MDSTTECPPFYPNVKPDGTPILACECCEGVPTGSHFDHLLRQVSGPKETNRLDKFIRFIDSLNMILGTALFLDAFLTRQTTKLG